MNQLKTLLLLGLLSVVFVFFGSMLGPNYAYAFGAFAILMNFAAYFWSDKIVLRMQRAREVSPEEAPGLHAMVTDLAQRADIPKPRIYIVPEHQPNAFATGRNPKHAAVAVTEGIMSLLTERELRGVLAHELAHIKNYDVLIATIAAAIATAITSLAHVAQFAAFFGGGRSDERGGNPWGALILALIAPVAALLIQMGISRSREYQADATGAQICGDPEALAQALAKLHRGAATIPTHADPAVASLFIVNPFTGRQLQGLFSTHPPMEERIRRLHSLG